MTSSSCVLWPSLNVRKTCLIAGIIAMLCSLVEMCFMTYKLVTLEEENAEQEKAGSAAKRGETLASVFLLLLIASTIASLSVIRGSTDKSRKNMLAWLLITGPVCIYGSVLITLDCVVRAICFRGVYRYYRHLAHEPHSTAEGRSASAVFTISGGESGGREGIVEVTVFPPAYEEVTVEGAPKYTVTSDGRVVPGDTKPPDYTP